MFTHLYNDILRNDFQTTLRINFHFVNFKQLNVKYERICHEQHVRSSFAMPCGNCRGLNEPFAAFVKEIGCMAADGNCIAYPSAGNIF